LTDNEYTYVDDEDSNIASDTVTIHYNYY